MKDQITLKNIRVYAYHGCLSEETKIGSDYRVDLKVETDLKRSSVSDHLDDTVDYVHLNAIVKREMSKASKLLEHVVERINTAVLRELSSVSRVETEVSKLNPPIMGDVEAVSIKMTKLRE
ncbi:dihydroneopterin aldolase [Mesohalobacter halotolerans]|uniref:7,8-dihydroneopterin aldolase n=1 Tax=Mesohalobacter halotolerans TaxID=1883405 RepID=A0A4U5TSU3_9FLAO|nr:dihydroneopterin aldolase [Mesohalobacter halotolerans]MBS3738885.1 dihydroneopterin aldolase [Psychroflexus sp.]TKS57400.1 dihydroneopterin aldolase [Mesohalobacter halotolerans]